jgi:hypothetical protein
MARSFTPLEAAELPGKNDLFQNSESFFQVWMPGGALLRENHCLATPNRAGGVWPLPPALQAQWVNLMKP